MFGLLQLIRLLVRGRRKADPRTGLVRRDLVPEHSIQRRDDLARRNILERIAAARPDLVRAVFVRKTLLIPSAESRERRLQPGSSPDDLRRGTLEDVLRDPQSTHEFGGEERSDQTGCSPPGG